MKKLLIALPLVALFGCASQQQPEKRAELPTVDRKSTRLNSSHT